MYLFSLAQNPFRPQIVLSVTVLIACAAGCATLPPPTQELAAARQAVNRAESADADQYASEAISLARSELAQAQTAMDAGRANEARQMALAAAAAGDLAHARSRERVSEQQLQQRRQEISQLQQRLQNGGEP